MPLIAGNEFWSPESIAEIGAPPSNWVSPGGGGYSLLRPGNIAPGNVTTDQFMQALMNSQYASHYPAGFWGSTGTPQATSQPVPAAPTPQPAQTPTIPQTVLQPQSTKTQQYSQAGLPDTFAAYLMSQQGQQYQRGQGGMNPSDWYNTSFANY